MVGEKKKSKKEGSGSTKKKATRATSNVFAMFTQNQIAEFKEAFQLMDSNKDGFLDKNDLRATYDSLGRMVNDSDLNEMINEAPGPINFTMFLTIFGERVSGSDSDDIIINAFKTFDRDGTGKCSEDELRRALTTWGEKLTEDEVDDAFNEASIDREGQLSIADYVKLITGAGNEEEEGAA